MAADTDINPTLVTQLNAALAALAPTLRGLQDLTGVNLSADLMAFITAQIAYRQMRETLINAVLAALDAAETAYQNLVADGYPNLPVVAIPGSLLAELNEEIADVSSATAIFSTAETGSFNPPTPAKSNVASSN
jgi:hypothetical protein